MAFFMKQMLGDKIKNMTGGRGGGDDASPTGTDAKASTSTGMSREEFEEYKKQMIEDKIERDKEFAMKKAERANLRGCLRDKYRLPDSAQDAATVQMAGDDVDLPEDLAKMVEEDEVEEEINDSFLGKLQNMDVDALKAKAQTTMTEVKQAAEEKCVVM